MAARSSFLLTVLAMFLSMGDGSALGGATLDSALIPSSAIMARRVFGEPLRPLGFDPSPEENQALDWALDAYRAAADSQAAGPLQDFLRRYPGSAWRPSLLLNLGLVYERAGHPDQSAGLWREAWHFAQGKPDPWEVGVESAGHLALQLARSGRLRELRRLLADLQAHPPKGPAATLVAEAGLQLEQLQTNLRCGPDALRSLAAALGQGRRVAGKVDDLEVGTEGASLAQIQDWGQRLGIELLGFRRSPGATWPVPAILQWRPGHFGTLVQRKGDSYRVQGFPGRGERWVSRVSLEAETGPIGLMPGRMRRKAGWLGVDRTELARILGAGSTNGEDPKNPCKGPDLTPCQNPQRMPIYALLPAQASVEIRDIPIWYAPPVGPAVEFKVTFNNTDVQQPQTFTYWNLGPKWTTDWLSYVIDDPANPGSSTSLYLRGGGVTSYSGYNASTGTFAPNFYHQDTLVRTSQTSYERRLPDGSKEEFTVPDGAVAPRKIFMTQIIDPAGNALTLAYDSSLRLVRVTDALGQVTTLSYTARNPLQVSQVQDPFGRSALLTYGGCAPAPRAGQVDQSGSFLASITDMGGLTTTFQYGSCGPSYSAQTGQSALPPTKLSRNQVANSSLPSPQRMSLADILANCAAGAAPSRQRLAARAMATGNAVNNISQDDAWATTYQSGGTTILYPAFYPFVAAMTTPYGTTTFQGGLAGVDRFIQATDPLGQQERIEYHNYTGEMPGSDSAAPSGSSNIYLYYRNSFYWDKRAMAQSPGDWTQAVIYHFCHSQTNSNTTSPTLETLKRPLESRVWYQYVGQGSTYYEGSSNVCTQVARILPDGTTQSTRTQVNAIGKPTQTTDALGRTTTYAYSPDGIDLLKVTNTTGGASAVLAQYTYNTQHRPLTLTDAAGQTTQLTYNPAGQVTTITNPRNEVTTLTYAGGYLSQVAGALTGSTTTYGYDAMGRANLVTDPQGRTVTTTFDNLDRPTQVVYPDGTSELSQYTFLDVTAARDRAGNWTRMAYNPLRQLIRIQDAAGRTTTLDWCNCGSLEQLTDPMGHVTNWWRDVQGRVIGKMLNDGTQTTYTYDSAGRLAQRVDAMGQATLYGYYADNNLSQVSYPNARIATPTVTYAYDPAFNRLATMADGFGTTTYAYNPITTTATLGAGRLATVSGPFPNSTITYTYDELGRVTNRDINGTGESRAFDALGRASAVANPLGTFTYSYVGGTNQLSTINLPNGQVTRFSYFDGTQDFRLAGISNQRADNSVISAFSYGYNPNGTIKTWSLQADANPPSVYTFSYDPVNQLLGAVLDGPTGSLVHQYAYGYDLGGNRTEEKVDTANTTMKFNDTNELTNSWSATPAP